MSSSFAPQGQTMWVRTSDQNVLSVVHQWASISELNIITDFNYVSHFKGLKTDVPLPIFQSH